MASLSNARVEKYYRKILAGFVVVTLLLVVAIAYFSFTKTTITINTAAMEESVDLAVDSTSLNGTVVLTDISGELVYTDIETTESRPGKATGRVTIVNNYSQDQPLIATTRLLSEGGVLFRTQDTVTVPAGGSVEVDVIADEEGATGDIGPSRFTVVALWSGLQEQIYATSTSSMSGGSGRVGVVTQSDIANAFEALDAQLLEEAAEQFQKEIPRREDLGENILIVSQPTIIERTTSTRSQEAGEEASSLTVSETLTVATVVVDTTLLTDTLTTELSAALGNQRAPLGGISLDQATMTIKAVESDYSNATIDVSFTLDVAAMAVQENIDKSELTNKTPEEIQAYLRTFDEIESAQVELSPFWARRSPALADSISIRVNLPE